MDGKKFPEKYGAFSIPKSSASSSQDNNNNDDEETRDVSPDFYNEIMPLDFLFEDLTVRDSLRNRDPNSYNPRLIEMPFHPYEPPTTDAPRAPETTASAYGGESLGTMIAPSLRNIDLEMSPLPSFSEFIGHRAGCEQETSESSNSSTTRQQETLEGATSISTTHRATSQKTKSSGGTQRATSQTGGTQRATSQTGGTQQATSQTGGTQRVTSQTGDMQRATSQTGGTQRATSQTGDMQRATSTKQKSKSEDQLRRVSSERAEHRGTIREGTSWITERSSRAQRQSTTSSRTGEIIGADLRSRVGRLEQQQAQLTSSVHPPVNDATEDRNISIEELRRRREAVERFLLFQERSKNFKEIWQKKLSEDEDGKGPGAA